jgi:hypothetical protein
MSALIIELIGLRLLVELYTGQPNPSKPFTGSFAKVDQAVCKSLANFFSLIVSGPLPLASVVPKIRPSSEPCHAPRAFGQQGGG